MLTCPDCGDPLLQTPGQPRLFWCPNSGLYYTSTRGKPGWPLEKPPETMVASPEPREKPKQAPDITQAGMTTGDMLRHPRFAEFASQAYSELPLMEALAQIRQADPATKRIIRLDFFKWLDTH